jgi:hypothetical protein
LTFTLGEATASVGPGDVLGMRRSEHGVADDRDIREGVPPVAEGTASL